MSYTNLFSLAKRSSPENKMSKITKYRMAEEIKSWCLSLSEKEKVKPEKEKVEKKLPPKGIF